MKTRFAGSRRFARWLRHPPRRWLCAGGTIGALILLTYAVAFLTDEPLRGYVEREVNHRLTGYSVRIRTLSVHPLSVSFDLRDTTIIQDARPDPPVAHIDRLRTSLHWRALLHGRVVADIAFDRPKVHLDLNNVRTEAASRVALKDRGWQRALEAIALDLKINRLRVAEGDITYVDAGSFKPLHLSRLNATVENIRNLRSKDRVYPSDVHVEAVVFDGGRLWMNGHADFLAEPHPGVLARFRLDRIELDYFRPITNRVNLSVRKGALTVVGIAEYAPTFKSVALDRVLVEGPSVDYVHAPQTAEAERARAQRTAQAATEVANDPSVRLRIDRLDIVRANAAFVNRAISPPYRVVLTDVDFSAENLSNQRAEGSADIRLQGKFMGTGDTRVRARFRPETRDAEIDVKLQVEDAAMAGMRDLVRAHGGVDVAAGWFSVYAEINMKSGAIDGYVKPVFRGVRAPGTMANIVARLLENRSRGEIATVVTLSGRVDRPEVSTWEVVRGLLQNAFFEAILPGFERRAGSPAPNT